MANRVLPTFALQMAIIGEFFPDVFVNSTELKLSVFGILQCHRDHGHVAVGRLNHVV